MSSSILSKKKCNIFLKRGHLPEKPTYWGAFQWVFCYQPTDKLISFLVKTALLFYSRRAKDVPLSGDLWCTSYHFGDILC